MLAVSWALGEELAQAVCGDTPAAMNATRDSAAHKSRQAQHNKNKAVPLVRRRGRNVPRENIHKMRREEKKEGWEGPVMGATVGLFTEPPRLAGLKKG